MFSHRKFRDWIYGLIMVILVVASQVVVQRSLHNETAARDFATTIGRQRGRAYAIVFDAVQMQHNQEHKGLYVQEMGASDKDWEHIQRWAYTIHVDPGVKAQIQASRPNFDRMSEAITRILVNEASPRPLSIDSDVGILLDTIDSYQQIFFSIFNALSAEADAQVINVCIIEAVLCLLTLSVIAFEMIFILNPVRNVHVKERYAIVTAS